MNNTKSNPDDEYMESMHEQQQIIEDEYRARQDYYESNLNEYNRSIDNDIDSGWFYSDDI